MAGHGSPPPPDRANHPARKAWGEGGPHPSLSDETVAAIAAKTARNSRFRQYDPDWQAEGEQLRREALEDRYLGRD